MSLICISKSWNLCGYAYCDFQVKFSSCYYRESKPTSVNNGKFLLSNMASSSYGSSTDSGTQDITEASYQPETFVFLKRTFGQKKVVQRSCQATWFQMWKWLHYVESGDNVMCLRCCTAVKKKMIVIKPGATDAAFVRSYNSIVVPS